MAQTPVVDDKYIGDGSNRVFAISWPYLSPVEVFVSVDGVNVPFAWLSGSASTVQTNVAPPAGSAVRVYRNTRAAEPLHKFAGGVPFLPRYVDENADQLLYALQEGVADFSEVRTTAEAALVGVTAAQAAAQAAQVAATTAIANASRAVRVPATDEAIPTLPTAALRANRVLGFDSLGNPIATLPASGSAADLALSLANSTDITKGAYQVGYAGTTVGAALNTQAADVVALNAAVIGRIPVVNSLAALRSFSGASTVVFVLGRVSGVLDASGGLFARTTGSRDDDGVYFYGTFAWRRSFNGYVHAAWYGVIGGDWTVAPLTVDYSDACQAAITCGCVEFGGVIFPEGHILISKPLVFPNKGYDVRGSSGTRTEFICNTNGVRMLDFGANNGPAKTIIGIGCSTNTGGYKAIIGFYTNNTNGLYLQNCWARGLEHGLRFHGSFINLQNCAFEYNYYGVRCYTSCQESVWSGNTFYKNEQVDVWLTGNNATFSSFGSNHIGTRVEGWRIDGCNNATILGITFENDGATGVVPILVRVTGISSGNHVHGMQVSTYGNYAISVEGANVVYNRFTGLVLRNSQVSGNRGIRCISTTNNYFEGIVSGWEAGVDMQGSSDTVKLLVTNCGIGWLGNAANYATLDITMRNNGSDYSVATGTITVLNILNADGNIAGLAGVPYLITRQSYNKEVLANAAPTALAWVVGDTCVNRTPSPGNVSRWRCVTSGTPGVWKPGEVLGV